MSFKNKFLMFMQGRYGIDSLGKAMFVLYLILTIINMVLLSTLIYIIGLLILIICIFRFFSKNISKRYNENLKYLQFANGFKDFMEKKKNRANDNKTYCFKRCPNCGKTLRLPRKAGKHNTKCPVCGCDFSVRVWFGKK